MFTQARHIWQLPPLILHPFADDGHAHKLVQSSRASLVMQGLLPQDRDTDADLQRLFLDGRFSEVRMLYYVGRDVLRWMEQCVEVCNSQKELQTDGYRRYSFAELLIRNTPPHVADKLRLWGVADHAAIFSRALALNAIFEEAPQRTLLQDNFLRHYHRYTDRIYDCSLALEEFTPATNQNFDFHLFASAEYSRILANEWQSQ